MTTAHNQFICPSCGGRHFGSKLETREDGSVWKVAEECHDEYGIACCHSVPVEPVMLNGPPKTSGKTMTHIRPKSDIPPQRFRWRGPGFFRWKFGVCLWNAAFSLWEIHTFWHSSVAKFDECPWESMGQVVGDCDEFEWIDNEMGWFGP